MCTSITLYTKDHYFGRNLDLDVTYGESVTITPPKFLIQISKGPGHSKSLLFNRHGYYG